MNISLVFKGIVILIYVSHKHDTANLIKGWTVSNSLLLN